jgi:hypothetical protein
MRNYYNPYGALKTPEQLSQEYAAMMQQYQTMYRNLNPVPNNIYNNQTVQQNAVSTAGDYRIVDKYEEVENTPTRLDGTASLFFDFDNMVFWSKKFVNGQHAIQSYKFMPINNNSEPTPTLEEDSPNETESFETKVLSLLEDLNSRVQYLEDCSKPKNNKISKGRLQLQGDLTNESE